MNISRTVAALPAVFALTCGSAMAQEVTLSAVYAIEPNNALMDSFLNFVDDVNENGEGLLQIQLRGGTEAVPRNEQMNAVALGIVDMYMGPAGYYLGELPVLATIDGSSAPANVMREAGFQDALDEAAREALGISVLGLMGTGYAFQFYTLSEPRISEDGDIDFSGMRIRGSSSYDAMYSALGITRVDIAAADVYTSLERGVIDGVGFTTIGVADAGWQDFLRYRIYPTWRQGNSIIAMNAAKRDQLTSEQDAFLMEMVEKHEMAAWDMAQGLEEQDTAALAEAGVIDIELEGAGAERVLNAFADTFWDSVADSAGQDAVDAFRPIVEAANAAAASE